MRKLMVLCVVLTGCAAGMRRPPIIVHTPPAQVHFGYGQQAIPVARHHK